jgi:hypothetical protein
MRSDLFKGILVGALVAAVVSTAAVAVAGTGIGDVLNLGQTNAVNAETTLQGNATGANLQLVQKGTGTALGIVVQKGKPPIRVSSGAGKATNLDADKLDGLDSKAFAAGGGKFFTGHIAFSQAESPANVVRVPGLGMLAATWDGSTVGFTLINSTGGPVDMTFEMGNGTSDGLSIASGPNQNILFNVSAPSNMEADVQIAWGSGGSAHFVRLTLSWFVQEIPGPHVMVFGYSR